ncbi:MAG: hypothetical protein KGI67_08750 [Pseudomonadota bacterium]|nr:hypothetical protein [Pseudomonadota bacterium]
MLPAILLACIALAACATPTPAERAARVQREVENMITVYGPGCARLGYEPDSDVWRDCILRLNSSHDTMMYYTRPVTTNCIGNRGFYSCTTF